MSDAVQTPRVKKGDRIFLHHNFFATLLSQTGIVDAVRVDGVDVKMEGGDIIQVGFEEFLTATEEYSAPMLFPFVLF